MRERSSWHQRSLRRPPASARVRRRRGRARARAGPSDAGGNEDQCGLRPPSAAKAKPPVQTGPAPAGSSAGSSAIRSRISSRALAEHVLEAPRPARDRLVRRSEPGEGEASRSGSSQRTSGRAASREANTTATGSATSTGAVTLTRRRRSPRTGAGLERRDDRLARSPGRGWVDRRRVGRPRAPNCDAAQASGRDRVIATSPVRAISIRPCGRTMRSKASILSWVPVTSIVRVRRETSTIWRRRSRRTA